MTRSYELHGVAVEVRASDPAVSDALDLRLRGFPMAGPGAADVVLEFTHESPPLPAGGRPVYDTPHGSLHYVAEADMLHGAFGGVSVRCEAGRGTALLCAESFRDQELYLATHPLSSVCLMELLERRGLFSLHAGCLADDAAHGVLLAGPSGSGKSTLALALARAGMELLSDDIVFLDQSGRRVLGFADAIGLSDHARRSYPELDGHSADGFPKRLRRIEDLFGRPPTASCIPRTLVFPTVTPDQPSKIRPLDPGEALVRLVPDVLATEPAATQAHLNAIAALLENVTCYELSTGEDLAEATSVIAALCAVDR